MPTFDNAHALIRSYIDADMVLDPGTYLLEKQLVMAAGERLRMTSEVTIQVKSAIANAVMVSGPNVTISGGTLRGMWEMTGQYTAGFAAGKVTSDYLLTAYALDWSGLVVENLTITRAGAYAMLLYSTYGGANTQSTTGATFTNVTFLENYWGIQIWAAYPYIPSGIGKLMPGVKFIDCAFDTTACADPSGTPDATTGAGDFIGAYYTILQGCEIRNCTFSNCGRISLELWGDMDDLDDAQSLIVSQCTFHNTHYRELSLIGCNISIRSCTFGNDPDWNDYQCYWEVGARNCEFLRCNKQGSGLFWPVGSGTWKIKDCVFTEHVTQGRAGVMQILGTETPGTPLRLANATVEITGNTAHYVTAVADTVKYHVVRFTDWDLFTSFDYSGNSVTCSGDCDRPGAEYFTPDTFRPDGNGGEMFFSFPENTRNIALI